jgi:hypothetical protein
MLIQTEGLKTLIKINNMNTFYNESEFIISFVSIKDVLCDMY